MSPRGRKRDKTEEDGDSAEQTVEERPKRRGRPPKSAAAREAAEDSSAKEQQSQEKTSRKRGRPKGSRNRAGSAETAEAAQDHSAPSEAAEPSALSGTAEGGEGEQAGQDGAQQAAEPPPAPAGEEGGSREAVEESVDASSDGRVRERTQRGGRGRTPQRKHGLNYRDLQAKILPELHLLAKEVELSDYRQMSKDELAVAILERSAESEGLRLVKGYLEISSDGYGFLQDSLLQNETRQVIVSAGLIKQFKLRTGDFILGKARRPRENERYGTLIRVEAVNNVDPFQAAKRPRFDDLVPTFPEHRIRLETVPNEVSSRVIDLLAPIGRGQRGLIVAPPKAGKTTLLKKIADAVVQNEPDIKVIVLLVDERPEEVTDFRESVTGVEVVASTFDEPPTNHIRVAEFVHERSRRIVEDGGHVMILLDSITRLARANNLVTPPTGRTLSGGLDSSALHWPKRFLGAARNIRGGGSLSILATALVETGSRMDDVIFEEFKGTGNMELHLSRRLEEKRIFPAIDILKSGTRREDLLIEDDVLAKMWLLRKVISDMDPAEAMDMLLSRLGRTKGNAEFLSTLGQG